MIRATVARNTGIISAGLVADKAVGVVKTALVAALFGMSRDLDAFLVALAVPLAAIVVGSESVATGALNIVVRHRAAGREREGWRVLSAFTNGALLVSAAVCAIYALAARQVVAAIAPGLDGATAGRAVLLMRVLAPLVCLQVLLGVAQGVLHAAGRFTAPSMRLALSGTVAVATLALLGRRLGVTAYALGMLVGDAAALAAHLPALLQAGWRWQPTLELRGAEVRHAFRFSAPMLASAVILQVIMLVEKAFASTLAPGSIACLDYGIRLLLLFYVFERALTNALFPHLAQRFTEASLERFRALVTGGVRAHLLVALPVTVGAILLREPLIRILLQRGAFDSRASDVTSSVAALYLLGLLGNSLRHFMAQVNYAMGDSRTPLLAAALSLPIYVGAAAALLPTLGVGALPLALSLAMSANAALMMGALARSAHDVNWRPVTQIAAKAVTGAAALGSLLWAARAAARASGGVWSWISLAAASGAGVALYGAVLVCLGAEEAREIGRLGRGLLRGRGGLR